jgi:GxxExxY protein
MEQEELTGQSIGAAIEVHRELGPGFLESIYDKALVVELRRMGLTVEPQKEIVFTYRGVEVGTHRLDLFVEDLIVTELKAIRSIEPVHFAVLKAHLKAVGRETGLILNFAKVTLEVKRARGTYLPGFMASSLNPPSPSLRPGYTTRAPS